MLGTIGGASAPRLIELTRELLEEEGLSYDLSLDRMSFQSAKERNRPRGQLSFIIPLQKNVELKLLHCWDGDKLTIEDTLDEAREIVSALAGFDRDRSELMENLLDLRRAAKAEVQRARRLDMMVSYEGVELEPLESWSSREPGLVVKFGILDHSLREVIESHSVDGGTELKQWFGGRDSDQAHFASLKRELERNGADGLIDQVTLNALQANGYDPFEVMSREPVWGLTERLDTPEGAILTEFCMGIFNAEIRLGDKAEWNRGLLVLRKASQRKGTPLNNRLVSDFVQHPFLPEDLRFIHGSISADPTYAAVWGQALYFNRAERRFWERE